MANNTWSSSGIIGIGFDLKSTTPLYTPGMIVPLNSTVTDRKGTFAMYIKANGVIGNSSYTTVDLTTSECLTTSVAGATGSGMFRNGSVAFADAEYGWVFCVYTAIPIGQTPPLFTRP